MTIALRIDPEDQTVDPGQDAVFTLHVMNQSGVVDRVAFDVLGSAGAWARVEPPAVALFPGTDATATMVITVPVGTPLGPVPLGVRATAETSGFVEVVEGNLNVGASRTVEAELRPRTATGKRRATSVVYLHNLGNAPTKVQVVATDPDDAIVFDAPRALQIGPGQSEELPLRMRLPSRPKQGASLPYSVLVEGGDTGQSLDGMVRQPAKKRWPIMAAMMALALLAAAFLFLRPQNAVAIKDGKADEPTTVAPLEATTTVVAAAAAAGPTDSTAPAAAAGGGGAPATTAAPAAGGGGGGGGGAPGAATPGVAAPVNPGVIIPTTAPRTTRASLCPGAKGNPQQTAQRVTCAWEAGAAAIQAEVGNTISQAARDKLGTNPLPGQVAGVPGAPAGGITRVPFTCRVGDNRGVKTMMIDGSGLVVDVEKCTATISS